jgi:hypothetical protein
LLKCQDVKFTKDVTRMWLEVAIGYEVRLEVNNRVEVGFVVTLVESVGELQLCVNKIKDEGICIV